MGAGLADGLLAGVFGEDDEAVGRLSGDAAEEGLNLMMAVDQPRADPAIAAKQAALLDERTRLMQLQAAQFAQEQRLRVVQARNRSRERALRRFSQLIRVGLQLCAVLVAAMAAVGLLLMLYDAFSYNAVVVEPFGTPPALAGRGLTGRVVAAGLADELTQLQAASRRSASKRNLSNAWTGEIRVQPADGEFSIGGFDHLLKSRLGHDVHVGGDLLQTENGGLALTVRGDGLLSKTFTGGAGQLDLLTHQAAGYLYGTAEPALYAVYLSVSGHDAEAVAFSKAAFAVADKADRPYILNQWGNALSNLGGSQQDVLTFYRAALKLKPDYWAAYNNLIATYWALGDEEGAWQAGVAMRKAAGGRPGQAPELDYQNWDMLTWNLLVWRAEEVTDADSHVGVGTDVFIDGTVITDIDARLHDRVAVALDLQTAQGDANDPSLMAMAHFSHGLLAMEAGDTARALTEMEAFGVSNTDPIVSSNYAPYTCWIAPAEEAAGRRERADAVLKAGGHFVDCFRFRGDILDGRGDWSGAQRAYAAAVALAPDLPAAYYSWGLALARHGDLNGAVSKLAAANRRGPHWADPLKAWGDVLVRQSRRREALAKYDEALRYAPAWQALQGAREAADR